MKQYLEFTDDKSEKFWEITQSGKSFTVRYGKIGATGQTQTKEFASEEIAAKEAEKLVGEKLKKGYLSKGTDTAPEKKSTKSKTAPPNKTLEKAVEENDTDAVKALFAALPAKKQKEEAFSYIEQAFMHKNREMIELFAAAKPGGYIYESAMNQAIDDDLADTFKLIHEYTPPDNPDINLNKVLMRAAKKKRNAIVAFMLDKGTDPNARVESDELYSPLIAAINNDDIDIVRLFLEKKIRVNFKADKTRFPLDIAEGKGDAQIINLLKESGARNATPDDKNIIDAAKGNKPDLVKELISVSTPLEITAALNNASERGYLDVLKIILETKLSKKELDRALNVSCSSYMGKANKLDTVKLLIAQGANPAHKDKITGYSVMTWAKQNNYKEVVAFLESGGETDETDDAGTIAEEFMDRLRSEIELHTIPCVRLDINEEERDEIDPLAGFIGGKPFVPNGFALPAHVNDFHFFGQINCAKVPSLVDFPEKGLLLFFLKKDEKYNSWDDGAVLYISDIPDERSAFTYIESFRSATKVEYAIDIHDATHDSHPYPRDHAFDGIYEELSADLDNDAARELVEGEFSGMAGENAGHRIGGYAFFTQEDPRYREKYRDYVQLLQIDELDGETMFWGDSGAGHFFIHPDDLRKRNFSNVFFHWDCY